MLYVKNRKSFKVRREFFIIILPRATKTLGKGISLPCAILWHTGNMTICRVL